MRIAVLGPGGVGGLLAALLARSGEPVALVARERTAAKIAAEGLQLHSALFGDFTVNPAVAARLEEEVDALIIATKATGLRAALGRIAAAPALILPLLNGLDHLDLLRERFGAERVLAGSIRVESDRPQPGLIVQSSPFLRIEMASFAPAQQGPMRELAALLSRAGAPTVVRESEAQVMWSKLVRLNALACVTSAYDKRLGEIRSTPELFDDLKAALAEAAAVARAEGAQIEASEALAELERAHPTLGSSMQRDIAAGREPELDAIPGAVLRAAARHRIAAPTIERLLAQITERVRIERGARSPAP
ncbi:MAG TPA: 2-dehydropantoate 2-reductase [Solirubrobacteraceae bacterium]|nr:2-dehydropantoate 2-reductase [Solirubrobacteraceae bacterium]